MFYQDVKGGGGGKSNFQQLGESRHEWDSIKSMTRLHNVVLTAVRKYREKKNCRSPYYVPVQWMRPSARTWGVQVICLPLIPLVSKGIRSYLEREALFVSLLNPKNERFVFTWGFCPCYGSTTQGLLSVSGDLSTPLTIQALVQMNL